MSQNESAEMNRRDFVTSAAAAAAAVGALATCCGSALGQATTQPSAAAGETVDVGLKTDFAKDGPVMTFQKQHHLLVIRQGGKIFAVTSKCTHKMCEVKDTGDHFNCPCHNSNFTYDGKLTDGPAKRALPRFAITVNADGHVIVDTKKTFPESKWDDAASFITVA